MQETLTLTRLGITGQLKRDARLDEPVRVDDRDRPPHQPQRQALADGDMCLRWTAAGMLEAEQQFRRIIGYSDLAKLAIAVERDVAAKRAAAFTSPRQRISTAAPEVAATTA